MLIVPNLIWVKHKPESYTSQEENKILLVFERVGQVYVTCTALIFSDFNLHRWSIWTMWLILAVILMVLYEGWWIHYFRSDKSLADFYSSYCGVPIAGATLPVAAFFLLGIYGKVIWLMISVVILGIGHIGIHLQHWKETQKR
jgi:hypothetical protein